MKLSELETKLKAIADQLPVDVNPIVRVCADHGQEYFSANTVFLAITEEAGYSNDSVEVFDPNEHSIHNPLLCIVVRD